MKQRRSAAVPIVLGLLGVLVFAALVALGTWQVRRLYWKLDLIERVEQRVHGEPIASPGPQRWGQLTRQSDEYRHVRLTGIFLPESTALVQAVTDLGSGFWMLTALRTDDGNVVLVNRGYVPSVAAATPSNTGRSAAGPDRVTVTGLLRMTEPGGGFLRKNAPAADRWYSRDVVAIAAARGLSDVAPYFIDQDAALNAPGKYPVGGLTVVSFPNNHLVYALTWYALALMVAAGGLWAMRYEARSPSHASQPG